jgi:2-polyprenyl-3-methyl-5-hydroxy-6-metoxy-1,4-benzoquinol methylase
MMPGDAIYWDDRFRTVGHGKANWYQHRPLISERLILECGVKKDAAIVDIGGGTSLLVDVLLDDHFTDITVVDLSQVALDEANERNPKNSVHWIQDDIRTWQPLRTFDLWHDRAMYHFLTEPKDQRHYWRMAENSIAPGGHIIVATFAEDGPTHCSGLPVKRYTVRQLREAMGSEFIFKSSEDELHRTPDGHEQPFHWVVATRR